MREELYKLEHESYLFLATTDRDAEVGARQITLWFRKKDDGDANSQQPEKGTWHFLRDFYFEETDYAVVRAFCQQFASDTTFRTAALSGESHWAKRNALFFRNLLPLFGSALITKSNNYEQQIHDFFHWLDRYSEQIIESPSYQRLQTIDNMYKPDTFNSDPLILPAVELFNSIPGIHTHLSCQGVSGKVQFQHYTLLTISHHEQLAYITFTSLSYFLHDSLLALTARFPSITAACRIDALPVLALKSCGDNIRFRQEIRELAQRLLTHVIRNNYRAFDDAKIAQWECTLYPEQLDTTNPSGILPTRLTWLCQPEHIEDTLKYVFFLSTWARASDDLHYDDRQGLYTLKAALLQQAYLVDLLQPVAYIDRSEGFIGRFARESAARYATEIFLDRVTLLVENQQIGITDNDEYNRWAQELFYQIMGRYPCSLEDIDELVLNGIENAIYDRLTTLLEKAYAARQPIKIVDLERLFIQPADLLAISDLYINHWSDLNEHQLRKLDPEGYSLVAFQYNSTTASYRFHLPYRYAEGFLTREKLETLPPTTIKGREQAYHHNRSLTIEESREHTPHEILQILALDRTFLFPHNLAHKKDRRFLNT
jgi:hypothetical protein